MAARSELTLRIWSALAMAAVALGTLWLGGPLYDALWLVIAVWMLAEWVGLSGCSLRYGRIAIAAIGFAAATLLLAWELIGLALVAIAVTAIAQLAFGHSRADRLWAAGGVLYAATVLVALVLLRHDDSLGIAAVLWMFAVVWSTDIAAYFTGRRLGGPKLMPSVSPKKTWSGFLGGAAAGTLAGLAVGIVAARHDVAPLGLAALTVLSLVASIAGQLGDLGESALKRHAGVKDSGHLIPGHGGILDRLDAFWAVALIVLIGLGLRALA